MGSVSTIYNGVRQKLAGRALMDVAFSSTSTNGVQNKVIKAKFDEVESDLAGNLNGYYEHIANGIETYKDIFDSFYSNIDTSKLRAISKLTIGNQVFQNADIGLLLFTRASSGASDISVYSIRLNNNSSVFYANQVTSSGLSITNFASNVPSSGTSIKVIY